MINQRVELDGAQKANPPQSAFISKEGQYKGGNACER